MPSLDPPAPPTPAKAVTAPPGVTFLTTLFPVSLTYTYRVVGSTPMPPGELKRAEVPWPFTDPLETALPARMFADQTHRDAKGVGDIDAVWLEERDRDTVVHPDTDTLTVEDWDGVRELDRDTVEDTQYDAEGVEEALKVFVFVNTLPDDDTETDLVLEGEFVAEVHLEGEVVTEGDADRVRERVTVRVREEHEEDDELTVREAVRERVTVIEGD